MFNKTKRGLLAMLFAVTMMSAGFTVNASAPADVDGASFMSARLQGSCGCTMDVEIVSKRGCSRIDDSTHMAEYYVTYRCPHGSKSQTEFVKETHTYGSYQDGGHQDNSRHLYVRSCSCCGDKDELYLKCYASSGSSGGHAVP